MTSDLGPAPVVAGETITAASGYGGAGSQGAAAGPGPSVGPRERGGATTSRPEPVQRITDAPAPHSDQIARRMRTYAISMGIRTLCVAAFVLLFPHWSAWLMVPGAALLPYVAVLLANAGREARPAALPRLTPRPDAGRRQLGSGRPVAGAPPASAAGPQ